MKNTSFSWMFLIVGTVIGAGYASGRELWQFFGPGSDFAILLFTLLFSIACYSIMMISYQKNSSHYGVILKGIVGTQLTQLYDIIIFIYLLATTVVMVAGSGAIGEAFQRSYWWGISLTVFALIIVFAFNVDGFLSLNKLLIPLLLFGLTFTLWKYTFDERLSLIPNIYKQSNWMAAFPFTSLNILPLVAVIGAIGTKIKSKAEIWIASFGSGTILGTITYFYNNSLISVKEQISHYEIPLFIILSNYSKELLFFMTIILWLAIFTTAASNILGITTRLQKLIPFNFLTIVCLIILVVIPLSMIGFTRLISYLYPAYGIINLYVLIKLLFYPFKGRGNP